jgi:hypothetical protein
MTKGTKRTKKPAREPFETVDIKSIYQKICGDEFDSYRQNESNPYSLVHPFRLLIVGSSNCGKNHLLSNMIMCPEYLPPFDKIYIFAHNPDQKIYRILTNLSEKEDLEFPEVKISSDIASAKDLLSELQSREDKDEQILVVFDDINQSNAEKKILEDYYCNSRPSNISVILLTQRIHAKTPTVVRTNSTHYILFKPSTKEDLSLLNRTITLDGDYADHFVPILRDATREKYNYLLIDLFADNDLLRLRKNFCYPLNLDYLLGGKKEK